jgi:hypothetical protein
MSIEAMKQALEALEYSQRFVEASANAKMLNGWGEQLETAEEAITSLRQAIAEAEKQEQGEPVAWRFKTGTFWNREPHWRYVLSLEGTEGLQGLEPLYTHPQPKREPLTDEEIVAINDKHYNIAYRDFDADIAIARAIEAAHGIKENT